VLDSTGDLVVRCGVAERELPGLRPGMPVTLVVEEDGRMVPGRLLSLAASPSPADGLYPIEAAPAAPLRPGALVRLRIRKALEKALLEVPIEALLHRGDRDQVFVLAGDRVRLREVRVEHSEGRRALIGAGLRSGERVVGEGAYFLQDGQTVRVAE
jgi:hypothetical protein